MDELRRVGAAAWGCGVCNEAYCEYAVCMMFEHLHSHAFARSEYAFQLKLRSISSNFPCILLFSFGMESSSGSPSSKVSSAKPGDLTLDQLKPGYIVHLKRKNQFDSRYLALSGIDEGGLHHPALVLSTVQDTGGNGNLLHFPGRVVTCVVSRQALCLY